MSNFGYSPIDLSDEIFSSEASIDLWISSIESQFKSPIDDRKRDYIESFITRYEYELENTVDDNDVARLNGERDRFFDLVIDIFEKYLSLGFPNIGDRSNEDQNDIIHLTYRFFIRNIKKNFVNIILNYINDYEDFIQDHFQKKNDVTTNNFKDELVSDYDVNVLCNLGDIIDTIFEELIDSNDCEEFFRLCRGDDVCLELEFVNDQFTNDVITGNFIEKYINMVDEDFKILLQSKVRNKVLKKYPYRKSDRKNKINKLEEND
jgi:hypothetical protein